jgi:predicted DNA-binding transcriptional regulator AlpA
MKFNHKLNDLIESVMAELGDEGDCFQRKAFVLNLLGLKRSSFQNMIDKGEFPSPIMVNERLSVWKKYEVTAVAKTFVRQWDKDDRIALVTELMERRKAG